MSHPIHGRVTGLQSLMLGLAGVDASNSIQASSDEELAEEMRDCRHMLSRITGVDYGYDLEAWHEYLLSEPAHHSGYTFLYSWESVNIAIQVRFKSPERLRIVQLAEQQ